MRKKKYWYFDASPFDNLGISKNLLRGLEKTYVVGGISGKLDDIVELTNEYGSFAKNKEGRYIVTRPSLLRKSIDLLSQYQRSGKISISGTIFHHYALPEIIRRSPELYQSADKPNEIKLLGMRGRVFAQSIWIPLQNFKIMSNNEQAIVCVDKENLAIKDCLKDHFKTQFPDETKAMLKIESDGEEAVGPGEGKGHRISDLVASIQSRALVNKKVFDTAAKLYSGFERFDSNLLLHSTQKNRILMMPITSYSGQGWPFMGDFLKINFKRPNLVSWAKSVYFQKIKKKFSNIALMKK